jgi:hypothetical protein
MDRKTATPVEIDTKLAELYGKQLAAEDRIQRLAGDIHRYAGDPGRQVSRNHRVYELDFVDAEIKARQFAATDSYEARAAQRILDTLDKMREAVLEAKRAAEPLEAEHDLRGWSRFFLVTSSDGHIHSSMHCSTCNPRTQYGWMPEVSGMTMAEAIAYWDKRGSSEILCTVCFPDAPVARTQKPVEEGLCPGSGTMDYPRETARRGYASGNYGVCSHCEQAIAISSLGRMRKHKAA